MKKITAIIIAGILTLLAALIIYNAYKSVVAITEIKKLELEIEYLKVLGSNGENYDS